MAAGLPSRIGPLVRKSQLGKLDELQRRFVAGEQWMLIVAINTCAVHELLMPAWVRQEWLKRSRAALHYKVKSWDDVMPVIKPKNSKLPALRRAWRWTLPVVMAVHAKSASGRAIDDGMFEELAEENDWPFKAGLAKKLYYTERNEPHFVPAFMRGYYFSKPNRRTGKNSTIRQRS